MGWLALTFSNLLVDKDSTMVDAWASKRKTVYESLNGFVKFIDIAGDLGCS